VNDAEAAAAFFASLPSTPSVQAQFPANGQITARRRRGAFSRYDRRRDKLRAELTRAHGYESCRAS
jgi:hypothetical protein